MMTLVVAGLQSLLVELAGVAVLAGVLYVYWNVMTKTK